MFNKLLTNNWLCCAFSELVLGRVGRGVFAKFDRHLALGDRSDTENVGLAAIPDLLSFTLIFFFPRYSSYISSAQLQLKLRCFSLILWLKRCFFLEIPPSDLTARINFVSLPTKNCCEMMRSNTN